MSDVLANLTRELHPPLSAAAAVVEADRCLECGGAHAPAPCMVACPAGVDVPSFVAAIAAGEPGSAAATIFAENILGGTCARVCPVEVLCQRDCVLVHEGRRPIEIGALQRYATDWAYAHGVPLRERSPANGKRVAVIGAGPAGLAAAGELAARGYAVTVYDERKEVGGLVRFAIAPYRQSNEPLPDEARLLAELGVEFQLHTRIDAARLEQLETEVDAIVIAVGMGADTDVSYEGDDLQGVWESLPFIEQLKTGRTAGRRRARRRRRRRQHRGRRRDRGQAARRRRLAPALPAHRAGDAGVRARGRARPARRRRDPASSTNPVAFVGDGYVEGVRCAEMRLGDPDESGRRRPEPIPGSEFIVPVDTVVKAIGQRPREEFLTLLESVDEDGRTANPKIFAAGDAINGGASVVQAVREAKRAVAALDESLRCAS